MGRKLGKCFAGFYALFICRIEYEERLMLLEIAQVPPDYVDEFKSVSKFRQVLKMILIGN
jgi:hypothetical protein